MVAIFRKEMRSYFVGVNGWVFLGFFTLITAFYFGVANVDAQSPYYTQTLSGSLIMFLILIPVLTMRLFAEEARLKTDQLLYTSPLTVGQIVMGKFLAAFGLFALGLAVTAINPIALARYGEVPFAETLGGFIGFFLLGACFIAVGIFISALTENQIVAAVGSFGALFLFFLIDMIAAGIPKDRMTGLIFVGACSAGAAFLFYRATKKTLAGAITAAVCGVAMAGAYFFDNTLYDGVAYKTLMWFSLLSRFSNFGMGALALADVVYYLSFAGLFVFLTAHVIERRRYA